MACEFERKQLAANLIEPLTKRRSLRLVAVRVVAANPRGQANGP